MTVLLQSLWPLFALIIGGYLLRRRAEVLCEVAGFEWDVVRDWSLVRETVNALWAAQAGGPGTRHRIGLAMTVLKALGD